MTFDRSFFYRYVILGAGNSAGYAAKRLIANGAKAGEIAIIGSESVLPYERPALSKAFLNIKNPPRLPGFHTCVGSGGDRQDTDWYKSKGISVLLNTKIDKADLSSKTLKSFSSGLQVTYDKLMVATGCKPVYLTDFNMQGADAKGIYYLRDNYDGLQLYKGLESLKNNGGGNVVIVGGGYLGMEVSAALAQWKEAGIVKSITVVFPESHLMKRLFTAQLAGFYENFFESKGINFITDSSVIKFGTCTDDSVDKVYLNNGKVLDADLVVVGIGARANTDLFDGQLELENGGIRVDTNLCPTTVNDNSIVAVGDVCSFPSERVVPARSVRLEHVGHARESATFAADLMTGKFKPGEKKYDYLPFFYSRFFNLSWKFYGDNPSDAECCVLGEMNPKLLALWRDNNSGCIVGSFLESGTTEEDTELMEIVKHRMKCTDNLWNSIKTGSISMESALSSILESNKDMNNQQSKL